MAIEWRRVPPALILSFAVDALRLVIANALRPAADAWSTVLALDVIGGTLATIGYAQLARRLVDRARTGAMLAGVASATLAILVLGAQFWRPLWMVPPVLPIAIGAGLAAITPRRWLALAVPAIVLPIAALVLPRLYLVWDLASIVTALAIIAAASSTIVAAGSTVVTARSTVAASTTVADASPTEASLSARPGHRLAIASSLLFAVSLCLPAFAITNKPLFGGGAHDELVLGMHCLVYGWIVIPGWIANPLVLVAAILHAYRKDRVAFPLVCLAIASAVVAPFFLGALVEVRYPHVGYFAWFASIVCLAVATRRADQMKKSGSSSAVGSTAYSEKSVLPSARSTSSSIRNLPV
jgi:hypothetical protein